MIVKNFLVTPDTPDSDHAIIVTTEQGTSIKAPVQARAVDDLQYYPMISVPINYQKIHASYEEIIAGKHSYTVR